MASSGLKPALCILGPYILLRVQGDHPMEHMTWPDTILIITLTAGPWIGLALLVWADRNWGRRR